MAQKSYDGATFPALIDLLMRMQEKNKDKYISITEEFLITLKNAAALPGININDDGQTTVSHRGKKITFSIKQLMTRVPIPRSKSEYAFTIINDHE